MTNLKMILRNLFKIKLKDFFNKYRGIFYSALLVLSIPVILFFTIVYSLNQFERNFNHMIQTKGTLLENIFFATLKFENNEIVELQSKIDRTLEYNQDIEELKILKVGNSNNGNEIVASSNKDEIGNYSQDLKDFLSLGISDGVAGIVTERGVRYWEVAKKFQINPGEEFILKTKISLEETDEAFRRSVSRAYWSIFLASLVLILLVTNYVRLNQYVLMYNKIKEVDEMKDNFVSMTSHELKTPLTAVNGYLDLLKSAEKKLNKEEVHYLDNIQKSTNHLKSLVEDILEVSRIEQGRISYNFSEVSVIGIVEGIIDSLSNRAQEKNLELTYRNETEEGKDLILVDPDRLNQIMINLVGNSIKYTEQGKVEVIIKSDNKKLTIAIEDTGIGMSAEEQKSLFGKFNRIKNEKTSKIEGTGLGLWITKQLIEQMKGEVQVESVKGKGSRFSVIFPKVINHKS
jgi:signal transduction histidine kinase